MRVNANPLMFQGGLPQSPLRDALQNAQSLGHLLAMPLAQKRQQAGLHQQLLANQLASGLLKSRLAVGNLSPQEHQLQLARARQALENPGIGSSNPQLQAWAIQRMMSKMGGNQSQQIPQPSQGQPTGMLAQSQPQPGQQQTPVMMRGVPGQSQPTGMLAKQQNQLQSQPGQGQQQTPGNLSLQNIRDQLSAGKNAIINKNTAQANLDKVLSTPYYRLPPTAKAAVLAKVRALHIPLTKFVRNADTGMSIEQNLAQLGSSMDEYNKVRPLYAPTNAVKTQNQQSREASAANDYLGDTLTTLSRNIRRIPLLGKIVPVNKLTGNSDTDAATLNMSRDGFLKLIHSGNFKQSYQKLTDAQKALTLSFAEILNENLANRTKQLKLRPTAANIGEVKRNNAFQLTKLNMWSTANEKVRALAFKFTQYVSHRASNIQEGAVYKPFSKPRYKSNQDAIDHLTLDSDIPISKNTSNSLIDKYSKIGGSLG